MCCKITERIYLKRQTSRRRIRRLSGTSSARRRFPRIQKQMHLSERSASWNRGSRGIWRATDNPSFAMWHWLIKGSGRPLLSSFGLVADPIARKNSIYYSKSHSDLYAVSVQSVRSALRRSPRGGSLQDLV